MIEAEEVGPGIGVRVQEAVDKASVTLDASIWETENDLRVCRGRDDCIENVGELFDAATTPCGVLEVAVPIPGLQSSDGPGTSTKIPKLVTSACVAIQRSQSTFGTSR